MLGIIIGDDTKVIATLEHHANHTSVARASLFRYSILKFRPASSAVSTWKALPLIVPKSN